MCLWGAASYSLTHLHRARSSLTQSPPHHSLRAHPWLTPQSDHVTYSQLSLFGSPLANFNCWLIYHLDSNSRTPPPNSRLGTLNRGLFGLSREQFTLRRSSTTRSPVTYSEPSVTQSKPIVNVTTGPLTSYVNVIPGSLFGLLSGPPAK
jgi:hypothetical protein